MKAVGCFAFAVASCFFVGLQLICSFEPFFIFDLLLVHRIEDLLLPILVPCSAVTSP